MSVEIEAPMAVGEIEEDSDQEVADLIEEMTEEEADLVIGTMEAHQDSMIEEGKFSFHFLYYCQTIIKIKIPTRIQPRTKKEQI